MTLSQASGLVGLLTKHRSRLRGSRRAVITGLDADGSRARIGYTFTKHLGSPVKFN
jgi:hypothetical protein